MTSTERRMLAAIAAVIVLPAFVAGCGRKTVAKVNGAQITQQEYYSRLEHMQQTIGGRKVESGRLILSQMINEQLILDLAKSKNLSPTEKEISDKLKEYESQNGFKQKFNESGISKEQLKGAIKVDLATFKLQTEGVKLTDAEVKDFYAKNTEKYFRVPEQSEVGVIITKSKADADKAISMLDGSAKLPFDMVARKLSPGKNSDVIVLNIAKNMPSIGEDIKNAIFSTPERKHTGILRDGKDFVIFQIRKHTASRLRSYDEVKGKLREQLMLQQGSMKNDVRAELEAYRKKAKMEIGIKRYEDLLKEQSSQATN